MSGFFSGLFGRDEPAPELLPPSPQMRQDDVPPPGGAPIGQEPAGPEPAATGSRSPSDLDAVLTELVRRVNRGGGSMPEGGVPGVHAVVDALRPLLRYLASNPPTEAEMIPIRAIVTDYLPTTVDTFLALPREFALTHRDRQGRTPAEELLEQLELLRDATDEYATAIYAGDAQELSNQGRFLQTKFMRSDLDL